MLTARRTRGGRGATSRPDGGADGANDEGDAEGERAAAAVGWPRLELLGWNHPTSFQDPSASRVASLRSSLV